MGQSRFYNINGAAYTDMIAVSTGKHLNRISVEMGYSPTFLKNLRMTNRVRVAVANQIEQMYGIPVAHYIVETKPAAEPRNVIPASVVADELMERIKNVIIEYFTEKKEVNE